MKDMKQPIFVYYELDNFYQNHRRYDVLLRFPDNYLNLSLLHKLLAITFPDVEIVYAPLLWRMLCRCGRAFRWMLCHHFVLHTYSPLASLAIVYPLHANSALQVAFV